ncbi:hypothetical protein H4S08_003406 [Coemansia sp. RSA 1365]|nr:hypothetical protein H4S08_003406 [Coemansia sp. RSA 1365]
MSELPHSTTLRIPFKDARLANIAKQSLEVDPVLSGDKVQLTIAVDGRYLVATCNGDTLRMVRVSINGFMDSLILATRTLEAFA